MPNLTVITQNDSSRFFYPYIVKANGFIRNIFAVPVKDAIGTINIDNAISVLKFREDTTEQDIVAKDFLGEVDGDFDFGFCPVFSNDLIVYTQTRWAVVANIKTGKVETPVLTMSMYDLIGGIISLDTAKNIFVIIHRKPAGDVGFDKILHVMKYEDDKFINLGEISGGIHSPGYNQPWLVHDRKIITYDSAANKLLCHDEDLKPSTLPFVEIFNRNSGKFRKLKEMIIHPTLPFGLVVEVGKDIDWKEYDKLPEVSEKRKLMYSLATISEIHALYLLRWDTPDTNKQYTPIHTDTLTLLKPLTVKQYGRFTFSPDGKWLVFGHEDTYEDSMSNIKGGQQEPFFIALPVSEKNPLFLGEPLFLGRTMNPDQQFTASAWATEPTAFVVADGLCMYKWDLGRLHLARVMTSPGKPISLE